MDQFLVVKLCLVLVACGSFINIGSALQPDDKNNVDPFSISDKLAKALEKGGPFHPPVQNNGGDEVGKNVIVGTNNDDFIEGTEHDDIIYGLKGDDQIYGFDGNDKIIGGPGNDISDGGPGNDTVYGNTGNDFVAGNTGSDILVGGAGDDILRGRNAFISEAEPDSFSCGPGEDTIDDFNPGEGDQKTSDCE